MPEPFFLPAATGHRFCLFHAPAAGVSGRGAVVYVHPFAEEMNKSRRMAALQARALAAAGHAVLQMDLHGCGDSSGDFADASWEGWVDDVRLACDWLQQRSGSVPWLWGLRAGCLLAAEAAHRSGAAHGLLLWQPVVSGRQYLQQFLRLKLAGGLTRGGDQAGAGGPATATAGLHEKLARGETVEVAGYGLSGALANGLARAVLAFPPMSPRVVWLDVSARTDGALSPLAERTLAEWQAAGRCASARQVCGPAFWQTAEIAESPALLAATLEAMAVAESLLS